MYACAYYYILVIRLTELFSAQTTEVLQYFNTLMNITSTDTLYHHTLPSINTLIISYKFIDDCATIILITNKIKLINNIINK